MNALPSTPLADDRWLTATYRVAAPASGIEARARAIAVEQSVEMPVEAIAEPRILEEIVGRVDSIEADGPDHHRVRVKLAVETTGFEVSQLLNMAFGNTSLQPDVELLKLDFPDAMLAAFGGPRFGIDGIRKLVGAERRALTCAALKPQGLSPMALAELAGTFTRAGIDVVKDDHGIANQSYSPFAERVKAVQHAVAAANRESDHRTAYAPTISGPPSALIEQARIAHEEGVGMVLVAPMLIGLATFHELVREHIRVPVLAHPALAGAQRIAAPLLLGKLFRILGADATIFPNHGGRFAYSPQTCRGIANCARTPMAELKGTLPVPGGGMSLARVPEMLEFYGRDIMLLIGGSLLAEGDRLPDASREFAGAVRAN
ncbi:RuBisCO large subunit C-terminal-like domain-containing protein [Usitatibacter palustris]|uniref:5-methylthioribulose-1-phosphate isomerase n=1 Tax=Usitatibacter palustris TaxID=2732487 RepID=A0A6M4H375_9PROT|nr:RuBisCO large subunit C-terminal-like domain-containing protein [Usitatibacter palustris]QJR14041.1 5-methylthioribulose-1-phosphate isomerase [Usitatibacter palustris]